MSSREIRVLNQTKYDIVYVIGLPGVSKTVIVESPNRKYTSLLECNLGKAFTDIEDCSIQFTSIATTLRTNSVLDVGIVYINVLETQVVVKVSSTRN